MKRIPPPEIEKIRLHFDESQNQHSDNVREGISTVETQDEYLWLGFDESTTVERLKRTENGYEEHRQFRMADYVKMNADDDDEMDIEGLCVYGGYLYACGSHSSKRGKIDEDDNVREQIKMLQKIELDHNRYTFVRIPVVHDDKGELTLAKKTKDGRRARRLKANKWNSLLSKALESDAHLGPYMDIPSKENGFDIEGLGVFGERVFLGLRGPVIGSYALILEIQLEESKKKHLKLKKIGRKGARYRKHFVNLYGMGIREIQINESSGDFYILAGPTMNLDGQISIFRIQEGLPDAEESITHREDIERLCDVTVDEELEFNVDKAEGLAYLSDNRFIVVYDSPSEERRLEGDDVYADIVTIPERRD